MTHRCTGLPDASGLLHFIKVFAGWGHCPHSSGRWLAYRIPGRDRGRAIFYPCLRTIHLLPYS